MHISDKVILTDVDGVLLDWSYSFNEWMYRQGFKEPFPEEYDIPKKFDINTIDAWSYIRQFNESPSIGWLTQFKDSVKYVKKLHYDHGFVFHCLSSFGSDFYAKKLREKNLKNIFGNTVFTQFNFIELGANKSNVLREYEDTGCVWVEDHIDNAITGYNLGLNCFLMEHEYNKKFEHPYITKVQNWRQVYEYIV